MDDEELFDTLLDLAEDGKVLGMCPKCKIPMHFVEILSSRCSKCGEINKEDILWIMTGGIVN